MSTSESGETQRRNRPPMVIFIILLLFFGLNGFYRVTQSPQFESYRTLDVIQLVVSGACFGVLLTGLFVRLLRPRR